MAIGACKHGKHVIVEKPMDITLEKANEMIKAAKQNKVKLAVMSQRRFDDSTVFLKNAVENNRLGKLVLGDASIKWFRSQEYYDSGDWRGTWRFDGGGCLMNQGIHAIDLLQYIMGDVESVSANVATLTHERIEVEDVATAAIRFKSGALGTIVGTTSAFPGLSARLEIHGEYGSATIDNDQLKMFEVNAPCESDKARLETASSLGNSSASIDYLGHQKQNTRYDRCYRK
ncbi:Gfo/Idh/MocA family protein [Fictibacillus terranigra]|uniref:Gfo/Idh/MocA family oxidoreductase n=1 Tax=Fictibacillus terranigra TaxID=3058424 RepID=A0ABT8E7L8_9BACL|nr:Gfo/Idh/MocA family oxidoreductase [Fictibacillus sp. CENA-BCM004]MDN4073893.1 Gfo/Idh/MocA family oxidoreductase [Fictibacillus sp. CENA-BCM004]